MKDVGGKKTDCGRALLAALGRNPGGMYARELSSLLGISRKEVIELLTNELRREVTTDGYTWFVADQARRTAFQQIGLLLDIEDWQGFDRAVASEKIEQPLREILLECKASAIASKLDETVRPDVEQARVLASPAESIRVKARAGSGKTRLITALTCFLIRYCGYTCDQVLLLAFNRDAAGQIEDRLTKLLNIPAFPSARTFHSLAYGLAAPEQSLLFDKGDDVATRELSALIQDILVGQLDRALLDKVYDLFRRETAEAKETGAFLSGESAYAFRRALTHYTLGGQAVKSRGEKFIGDFLFEHGIEYFYERPTPWDGGWYRPDFTIVASNNREIVWEHWAIDPDALKLKPSRQWPEDKLREYQKDALRKREFWRAKNVPLLESCAQDCLNRELFEFNIAERLRPFFPKLCRLPKQELLQRVKEIHLSRLSNWVGQAIQRAEQRGLDAAGFKNARARHIVVGERERLFLSLVDNVFAAYELRLDAEGRTDFARLFNQAIKLMRSSTPQTVLRFRQTEIDLKQLRYCLVDEAQDLSQQFIEVVTCLRELNPRLRLLFVGDDWQAINRFAGSEVELFERTIPERFGDCATLILTTNYRSARKVVLAGNSLMRQFGVEAQAHKTVTGTIELAYMDQVFVEGRENEQGWESDAPFRGLGRTAEKFFKALYQLAAPDLLAGKTIGVIFRKNKYLGRSIDQLEQQFLKLLRQMGWPREEVELCEKHRIRFSTAHRFKGAERNTIFIVNPSAGSFPLLNAESLELFRMFGDNIIQAELDERRLFYVAITRAEDRLVFLTETHRDKEDSPYLHSFRELIDVIRVPREPVVPKGAFKQSESKGDDHLSDHAAEEIIEKDSEDISSDESLPGP